jgi:hypothetical protein
MLSLVFGQQILRPPEEPDLRELVFGAQSLAVAQRWLDLLVVISTYDFREIKLSEPDFEILRESDAKVLRLKLPQTSYLPSRKTQHFATMQYCFNQIQNGQRSCGDNFEP